VQLFHLIELHFIITNQLSTDNYTYFVHFLVIVIAIMPVLLHTEEKFIEKKVHNCNTLSNDFLFHILIHYVIKFVSDLQVGCFLRFLPPIKLTATI